MIALRCPYCDELRYEDELAYGGEATVLRPAEPAEVSDETWTDYLFMRSNPKDVLYEQWCCAAGCGQWFKTARHTVTHLISETIRFDAKFNDLREKK